MHSLPFQPADVAKPASVPGPVLKANSLSNLEQEKATYRYRSSFKLPRLQTWLLKDISETFEKMLVFTLTAPPGGHYPHCRKF